MHLYFGNIALIAKGVIKHNKNYSFICSTSKTCINYSFLGFFLRKSFSILHLRCTEHYSCLDYSIGGWKTLKKRTLCKPLRIYFSTVSDINPLCYNSLQLADKIIEDTSGTSLSSRKDIAKFCDFLLTHGFSESDILKCCQYFSKSPQDLYMKAVILTEMGIPLTTAMPLMKLSLTTLRMAVKRSEEDILISGFSSRIAYLCCHLQLSSEELVNAVSLHSSLITMDFQRLEKRMNVLKSAEIDIEHIVKDLWIFNYNEKCISDRVRKARKVGLPVKPWLLRCPEKVFLSFIFKWEQTKTLLNGKDEIEYLASKLNCSEEYVKLLMEKNKLLTTINIPKLEQVINFLYERGYTPEELRLFPRIFCSSVNTLSKRFAEFYNAKGTMPTLSQLCFSTKSIKRVQKKHNFVSPTIDEGFKIG